MVVLVTEAMKGTATYVGPAAGKYVTKTFRWWCRWKPVAFHFTASRYHLTASSVTARMRRTKGYRFGLSVISLSQWHSRIRLDDVKLTAVDVDGAPW